MGSFKRNEKGYNEVNNNLASLKNGIFMVIANSNSAVDRHDNSK